VSLAFRLPLPRGPAREFLILLAIIVIIVTKAHVVTKEIADRLFSGIITEIITEISYQIVAAAAAASTATTTVPALPISAPEGYPVPPGF
jgi:hypothetical protein